MPDWEERITGASDPSLRLEHVARYRAAAPIALASEVWCDLALFASCISRPEIRASGAAGVAAQRAWERQRLADLAHYREPAPRAKA